jgi:hypothetical protein
LPLIVEQLDARQLDQYGKKFPVRCHGCLRWIQRDANGDRFIRAASFTPDHRRSGSVPGSLLRCLPTSDPVRVVTISERRSVSDQP